MRDCEHDKNKINPLERMEGSSPGTQASALVLEEQALTTQTGSLITTFLAERHHPRQGDKQEKTFLSCGVLPSRQHL